MLRIIHPWTQVLRRVAEAKAVMEAEMVEELEKRRQEQLAEAERREVRLSRVLQVIAASLRKKTSMQN